MLWLRPLRFNLRSRASNSFVWFISSKQSTQAHAPQPYQEQLLSLLLKHQTRNQSMQIHSQLITTGLHRDSIDETGMMIWNTLIRKYSQGCFPEEALQLYKQMHLICTSFIPTDSFTFSFLLKACANLLELNKGVQIHGHVIKVGFEFHVYVQTALVNMYSLCGSLSEAKGVFDKMPERNSVTWNAMITGLTKWGELNLARSLFETMPVWTVVSWTGMIDGYTRINQPTEALIFFRQMMMTSIKPTEITILCILPAISNMGDLHMGQSIHAYCEKNCFNLSDVRVSNALIDTYAKCGSIENACGVFEEMAERRNLVSWSSIISGFAMHGMAKEAIAQFTEMGKENIRPNRVTFLSVLNACSHGGLVAEGLKIFNNMRDRHGIVPDVKHYGCMIDMLGRAGRLEEAEKMVMEMPMEVNVIVWRTLLGACSFHGDVEMGERVMKRILEKEREYGGDYVLLSNIFAGVGRFGDVVKLRSTMDERNLVKAPGLSLINGMGRI